MLLRIITHTTCDLDIEVKMATRVFGFGTQQSQNTESSLTAGFDPDPTLILQSPPPLDPAWLAHEEVAGLLQKPVMTGIKARQQTYSQACRDRNARLLSGRDEHLNHGIHIHDTCIELGSDIALPGEREPYTRARKIPIRSYNPSSLPSGPPPSHVPLGKTEPEGQDIIIYYHGGGLVVGDLDSEDLTCRRICKDLGCTVYSCDYRLMPEHSADEACDDAFQAFVGILRLRRARRLILMGSSSGGQLAAMIAGSYGRSRRIEVPWRHNSTSRITTSNRSWRTKNPIHGVLLRGPVTCDASNDGVNIPPRFRPFHTSSRPEFHTSLLSTPALSASNRTTHKLPLEDDDFSKMPRHWIQVSTNDILYSDGILFAEALKHGGVEVKIDIVQGYPHTFWLKAPDLERAVKAERDMIEGLRWLLEAPEVDEGREEEQDNGKSIGRNFVPFTDEEFERYFSDI